MPDDVDELAAGWRAHGMPEQDVARLALGKRVARLALLFEQALKAELSTLGLTYAEFDVLAALHRADRPLRPNELTRALYLTSGGTSNVLTRLTAAGYVTRAADDTDARGTLVHLTPEGAARTGEAMTASVRVHEEVLAGIPDDAVQAAADALRDALPGRARRR